MRINDRIEITDKRTTRDGYLVTTANFARSGIYEYSGRELGKPEMETVRVFRPEDEVFSAEAMASFAHRPVTDDHPPEFVDAANWRKYAKGFTDGHVARDGDFVQIPMMVTDANSIANVDAGKSELSAGYDCDIEFIDGKTDKGETYDAIMRNIRGNHIAIVDRGRAGSDCRIGDEREPTMKKIMFDGIEIEATEQSAQAIAKLEGKLRDSGANIERIQNEHKTALDAKDRDIAAKDTQIADLTAKVVEGPALDKMIADRATLVSTAGRIVDGFDASGKTAADIKRGVVLAKCGDAAVKDKSDAYIDARFDTLAEGISSADPVREIISGGHVRSSDMGLNGKSVEDLRREEAAALRDSLDLNKHRTAAK